MLARFERISHVTNFDKYTVMQSDRNSSKAETFHNPTTYEPHIAKHSDQIITFARHEYGRVEVFRIRIRSLVQKL